MRCKHNLCFVWDYFKHIGGSQCLEIITTSEEIMSFHGRHGVVVSWFGLRRNESYLNYLLVKGGYDLLVNSALYVDFITIFYWYSSFAFLVMSFERYLGAYYLVFHHTSVTRRRLLTFLAILLIFFTSLYVISTNDMIIARNFVILIFTIISSPPLLYMNFKLFKISRYLRRTKTSPGEGMTLNLKSISANFIKL